MKTIIQLIKNITILKVLPSFEVLIKFMKNYIIIDLGYNIHIFL